MPESCVYDEILIQYSEQNKSCPHAWENVTVVQSQNPTAQRSTSEITL